MKLTSNMMIVLAACDKIQTFKLVVKSIARKHGLYATFMQNQLQELMVQECTVMSLI